MAASRLQQLLDMIKQDPDEPFLLYAIALEYNSISDSKNAEQYFEKLLTQHENYVPVYYHAAAFYSEKGEKERADMIYQKGITIAEKLNDRHALKELKSAYTNFQFDE